MSDPGEDPFGLKLKAGDVHYRAYVGPARDYDLVAGLQSTPVSTVGSKKRPGPSLRLPPRRLEEVRARVRDLSSAVAGGN